MPVCDNCQAEYADFGDGYAGLCPACADRQWAQDEGEQEAHGVHLFAGRLDVQADDPRRRDEFDVQLGQKVFEVLDEVADMNMDATTIMKARDVMRELQPEQEPLYRAGHRIAAELWEQEQQNQRGRVLVDLTTTEWAWLRAQKAWFEADGDPDSPYYAGLLALLDFIQDAAAVVLGEEEVFGERPE